MTNENIQLKSNPTEIYFYDGNNGRSSAFLNFAITNSVGDVLAISFTGVRRQADKIAKELSKGEYMSVSNASSFSELPAYDSNLNSFKFRRIKMISEKKKPSVVESKSSTKELSDYLLISHQYQDDQTRIKEYKGDLESTAKTLLMRHLEASGETKKEVIDTRDAYNEPSVYFKAETIRRVSRFQDEFKDLLIDWNDDLNSLVYNVLYSNYSVPIIEEWIPYLVEKFKELNLIKELYTFSFKEEHNYKAYLLGLTDDILKAIISEGIQSMDIIFANYSEIEDEEDNLSGIDNISDYLMTFGSELGEVIQDRFEIGFSPNKDVHHPSFHELNLTANNNGVTGYYPPQANTIMGIANSLQTRSFNFVIGEMGVGKTGIGVGVPYITEAILQGVEHDPDPKRVIVMSPAIVVEKWAREIEERLPNVKTFIVKNWKELKRLYDQTAYYDENNKLRFKEPETFEYYIFSSESPKMSIQEELDVIEFLDVETENNRIENDYKYGISGLSIPYTHTATKEDRPIGLTSDSITFKCPSCNGRVEKYKEEKGGRGRIIPAEIDFFYNYNKKKGEWKATKKSSNSFCKNVVFDASEKKYKTCGHSFWQPKKDLTEGRRAISPIWYLNQKFPRGFFKYLILDEAHEFKGKDSNIGTSLGQLINHTEKQILLTGTLIGGMSEDIYWLLAKLTPEKLASEGIKYGEATKFINRYGVSEYIERIIPSSGNLSVSKVPKPGINPHLFPTYLMENATFLELNDMGYALPKYEEIPVFVDMSPEHQEAYSSFTKDFVGKINEASVIAKANNLKGGHFGFNLINSLSQYADIPANFEDINLDINNQTLATVDAPAHFDVVDDPASEENLCDLDTLTKYTTLVENIETDLYDHDRKSLVYVSYTGTSSVNRVDTWLYDRLKERGLNVGLLSNHSSYDGIKMPSSSIHRESWLKRQMKENDWDVLITNPSLVKVGLDLLDFPNIHFYQMKYSTYDYMQASRRSWRIRQTKPVKVYTYAYRGTVQEMVLMHMARKIDSSLALQGRLSEEGLRSMSDTGGLNDLAKSLIKNEAIKGVSDVYESFKNKNQTFEKMQSVEFQEYDSYVMNPIEGGIERIKEINSALRNGNESIKDRTIAGASIKVKAKKFDVKLSARATEVKPAPVQKKTIEQIDVFFDQMIEVVNKEDVSEINKKRKAKSKITEGQVLLLF